MHEIVPKILFKVKERTRLRENDIFLMVLIFLLVLLISGVLQLPRETERYPIQIRDAGSSFNATRVLSAYIQKEGLPGIIVASRKGTRYYYPWCGGTSRLSEKNKIWFNSPDEAEKAGYTIASGCEGL